MKCVNHHQALILCLFIVSPLVITFKIKPYRPASYSYRHQVYPVEGLNNTYTIYVAGESITIEIPEKIESNLKAILEWQVLNTDEDALVFVSGYEAYVMIDKDRKHKLERSGYMLSGRLIHLGENKAISVRFTENPLYQRSMGKFTFVDLLYFDIDEERVEIIDSIRLLDDADGDNIGYWVLLDYIFIGDKLYLGIAREFSRILSDGIRQLNSQVSVMRLCLEEGNNILSSAVEIYAERDFTVKGHFVFKLGKLDDESKRFSLLVERNIMQAGTLFTFNRFFIPNYLTIFDEVAVNCAKGVKGYTTLHDVSKFTGKDCQPKSVTKCSFPKFQVPSYKLNTIDFLVEQRIMTNLLVVHDGHPLNETRYIFRDKNYLNDCLLSSNDATLSDLSQCVVKSRYPVGHSFLYFNYITSTVFWLEDSGKVFVYEEFNCLKFKDCFNCIMFGYPSKCTWNGYQCSAFHYSSTINVTSVSVDFCAKITNFKPKLVAGTTKSKQFFIDFDGVPWNDRLNLKIYVTIGPNQCTRITNIYASAAKFKILCDLDVRTRGKFPINLTFAYERYGNTIPIIAISKDRITFKPSEEFTLTLIIQYVALFIIIFTCLVTVTCICCDLGGKRRRRLSRISSSNISIRRKSMYLIGRRRNPKAMSPKLKWKEFSTIKVKYSSDSTKSGSQI